MVSLNYTNPIPNLLAGFFARSGIKTPFLQDATVAGSRFY
jgi:hypothetical protein